MERIVSLLYRNSTRIELATGCRRRCAIRYLISAKFSLIGLGLERAFFPEVIPHLFLYRGPIEIYNLSRSTFLITLLLEWLPNDEWLWCNKSGIRTQVFGQCRICPLDPNIFTEDDFVTDEVSDIPLESRSSTDLPHLPTVMPSTKAGSSQRPTANLFRNVGPYQRLSYIPSSTAGLFRHLTASNSPVAGPSQPSTDVSSSSADSFQPIGNLDPPTLDIRIQRPCSSAS